MDFPNTDFLIEFLEVVFHNIIYLSNVYPPEIFENRKKYNAPIKLCIHPDVNGYINNFLKTIKAIFKVGSLEKIVLRFKDDRGFELQQFNFELGSNSKETELSNDEYYIKCEQTMRAFCYKSLCSGDAVKKVPEDSTFELLVFTTESVALQLQKNTELEHFPMIYHREQSSDDKLIVPMDDIDFNGLHLQMYALQSPNMCG